MVVLKNWKIVPIPFYRLIRYSSPQQTLLKVCVVQRIGWLMNSGYSTSLCFLRIKYPWIYYIESFNSTNTQALHKSPEKREITNLPSRIGVALIRWNPPTRSPCCRREWSCQSFCKRHGRSVNARFGASPGILVLAGANLRKYMGSRRCSAVAAAVQLPNEGCSGWGSFHRWCLVIRKCMVLFVVVFFPENYNVYIDISWTCGLIYYL